MIRMYVCMECVLQLYSADAVGIIGNGVAAAYASEIGSVRQVVHSQYVVDDLFCCSAAADATAQVGKFGM